MAQSDASRIRVDCACGAALRAPATAAGKRIKCPKCGEAIPVPTADEARPPAPPPADDLLTVAGTDFSQPDPGAPAITLPPLEMAPVKMTTVKKTKDGQPTRRGGRIPRGFGVGVALCAIGGAVSAWGWYQIELHTGAQAGLIAVAVGALCGFGFAFGNGGPSRQGAMVAALIAGGSVMSAKFMIYSTIMSGDSEVAKKMLVKTTLANSYLAEKGLSFPSRSQRSEADRAASEAYEAMSPEARTAMGEALSKMVTESDQTFFESFRLFDYVMIIVALGAAYSLAKSGLGGA